MRIHIGKITLRKRSKFTNKLFLQQIVLVNASWLGCFQVLFERNERASGLASAYTEIFRSAQHADCVIDRASCSEAAANEQQRMAFEFDLPGDDGTRYLRALKNRAHNFANCASSCIVP